MGEKKIKLIQNYENLLRFYKADEEFFSKKGFTFSIADRILHIALLYPWDAYYLFYYAKRIPDKGGYLEIGGGYGSSTLCVYLATQLVGTTVNLVTIDPFVPFDGGRNASKAHFIENTKDISHLRVINCSSDVAKSQIADNSVDLVFVDGDHHYEQVKRDLENYWPKLKAGGVLLGHDYQSTPHPGVKRATDEVFGKDKLTLLKNSSIFMVRKWKKD